MSKNYHKWSVLKFKNALRKQFQNIMIKILSFVYSIIYRKYIYIYICKFGFFIYDFYNLSAFVKDCYHMEKQLYEKVLFCIFADNIFFYIGKYY